ncbi:phospholipid-transporting ATPase ABCA1-like isoform X2 [Phymastichus coffea]|uniref:phospholipid-transporting ATPase ABCA1-like isoform X2 n=1 Tax=Phymastichus coffea TaxID=108790 RepID=UPI00273AEE1C|nr:phospholipid-transporting ATPase ABCA1-like isoform X2 [Phymastichus coffea]
MVETLRILGLLLHKNWLVRKRQWLMSLIAEIMLPVGIIACAWALRGLSARPPTRISTESRYRMQPLSELIDQLSNVNIFYAPNSSFVNDLMKSVDKCFEQKSNVRGFRTEEELVAHYYKHVQYTSGMAVIFDDELGESTRKLRYKLRGNYMGASALYNVAPPVQNMTRYYTRSHAFTQVQTCVDESFVRTKSGVGTLLPRMSIQRVPYPPHTVYDAGDALFREVMYKLLVTAFFLPQFVEISKATAEKFLGTGVLMSMNGISNALNLFSWLISGLLFLSVFCVLPIFAFFVMPLGDGLAFVNYGNPLVVFLIFTVYVGQLLAFGAHVAAYCSRSLLVMFVLLIANILTMVLKVYAFKEDSYYLVPYVGILLPNLLLHQAMEEVTYYETIAEGIQWHNVFLTGNAAYKIGGSVGMILILGLIGMILHYALAIYVNEINPGKYGVRKSPLYFLRTRERWDGEKLEDLSYDGMHGKPFEPTPAGIYTPGIQLRNLRKAYNIGLLNREKVEALKGISVDFYKGQITSLLGHNGAGKTTMMSILTGMMSPSGGTVLIASKDMSKHSKEIMNDMGLCTQENMLFPSLSVIEQIEFFAELKRKDKARSVVQEEAKAFLRKLKLYEKRHALPKQLSGGQKRRLCLGMALVGDSSTLILDEPTSGLDPESRRVIWDILLKMRGEKTIVISTHDMEEADILGDRIAILHSGQLRSYGTSLFLKKLIGQGNVEVTLSVEADCDPRKICAAFACDGVLVNQDASKVVLSIPYSPELPDQLDILESKKKELRVSGFSVSLISLEQVFLKVTQENAGPVKAHRPLTNDREKLTNHALFFQYLRALLLKKMTYTGKNMSIILLKLFTVSMALLTISLILKQVSVSTQMNPKITPISLDMYNKPETYYLSYDQTTGDRYRNVTESLGGDAMEATKSSLTSAMLKYAEKNLPHYENYLIAAAEFNETGSANAFYSDKATFSLPISVNLIWNTILKKLLGDDYSISLSSQELPSMIYLDVTMINGIMTSVVFVFQFCSVLALFVVHPLRESSKGVKQLQRMTGVSGLAYWTTMFLFDFLTYLLIVFLIIAGFLTMDYFLELRVYGFYEISLLIFLFAIFAVNALPFVYIFSFINAKIGTVVRLLTYIPLGIVTVELVMYAMKASLSRYKSVEIIRYVQKGVFLCVPYVSFFHTQMSFYLTAMVNARCAKMPNEFYDSQCEQSYDVCCNMVCYNGTCGNYKSYFTNFEEDITLEESVIYLCLTPVLYFGILALLETQYIENVAIRFRREMAQEVGADEQVQREKSAISRKIEELKGTWNIDGLHCPNINDSGKDSQRNGVQNHDAIFLVHGLRKRYNRLIAVRDVSFRVNRHECFGLLGVNGAGKSTTFKMMTGGEVADNGAMYINGVDIKSNRRYFLSQMGYCPQQDAIIKSLNSYDHLRLFALLRGIPKSKIEDEVQAWIERLNLSACALQPSGTYSGGNKRRLNIAIALIGNPNLVLMDEPTTGVDPGARRSLWNVIKACQTAGQAVVLTSHSMEECEALCNRLAIMVGGRLVCTGPSEELKQRFGAGYDIQIRMDPGKMNGQLKGIKSDVKRMLDVELTDENLGYLMYHVAPKNTTWRKMYDVMNEMKSKYDCIDDFSVLSSSLEQLFLLFARAANRSTSWSSEDSVVI